jgi:hypothetical protein
MLAPSLPAMKVGCPQLAFRAEMLVPSSRSQWVWVSLGQQTGCLWGVCLSAGLCLYLCLVCLPSTVCLFNLSVSVLAVWLVGFFVHATCLSIYFSSVCSYCLSVCLSYLSGSGVSALCWSVGEKREPCRSEGSFLHLC